MLHYKTITTNTKFPDTDILRIPLWLLGVDDLALLLGVTSASQLPIIEKALRLVPILKGDESVVSKHKNDIIARCVLDILINPMQYLQNGILQSEHHLMFSDKLVLIWYQ